MIKIAKPIIVNGIEGKKLVCEITANYLLGTKTIYFEVLSPFDEYLTDEVSDAFMFAALLPALKHNEDIEVEGVVSEKLYFNLIHTIRYVFAKAFKTPNVNINVGGTQKFNFGGKAVGCGCSLGVDSLAAIFSHLYTPDTPDYQITHLTYFNVGSHGYKDAEANHKSWLKDMKAVEKFAADLNLPVVKIESNVYELFEGFDFDQAGHNINMATVLTMQKLFGKYLYSSSYPVNEIKLTDIATGFFEGIFIPGASTESTELLVANPDMTRTDKTRVIVENDLSKSNLYVCWKELIVNNNPNHPIAKIKDKFLNCTRCDKCLRTCACLEIIGKIDEYSQIFDVKYFEKIKDKYFGKILAYKGKSAFYKDIVDLAGKEGYKFSNKAKLICFLYRSHIMSIYVRTSSVFKRVVG